MHQEWKKARVSHEKAFAPHELRNVAGNDYFCRSAQRGFTARAYHIPQKSVPNILAYERVDVPGLGMFVFGVNVDIHKRLKGFSQEILEEEGERVYIADDTGAIIDHYNAERVGNSLLHLDFVKKVLEQGRGRKIYVSIRRIYRPIGGENAVGRVVV